MISPPARASPPAPPTRGLGTLLVWLAALICVGAAASAALALGSRTAVSLPAWLPAWLLLLLAGLGAAAGVSAAAAAVDRGWYVTSACCIGVTLATSLPALLLGEVRPGHGFAFALPAWLGMGSATLFLGRADAWADSFELLAELPLLLLLLHLPLASCAAASWLPAGGVGATAAVATAGLGSLAVAAAARLIVDGALRLLTLGFASLGAASLLLCQPW